jgi:MoxR-like ATPase
VTASPEIAPSVHESNGRKPMEPEEFQQVGAAIEAAVAETIVGQREAIRGVLICLAAGGHALLEGVPGLGKTTMARAFAGALDLSQRRVQFTPDLMPADITGTTVLTQGEGEVRGQLHFEPGPLFANLVVADEINRAAPRTQSALLEAMQEGRVTIANTTHLLPEPFFVLATQNPIELYGTYPLPEAELDRFLLKLRFEFPPIEELNAMVLRTTGDREPVTEKVADASTLLRMNALVRTVPIAAHVVDYASRIVLALHPDGAEASERVREYVRLGPSPRGVQTLCMAGRVSALMAGRLVVAVEDIRAVAAASLRHRLLLSFDAERQAISADEVIAETLQQIPREAR